jgi:hypothetical protein
MVVKFMAVMMRKHQLLTDSRHSKAGQTLDVRDCDFMITLIDTIILVFCDSSNESW